MPRDFSIDFNEVQIRVIVSDRANSAVPINILVFYKKFALGFMEYCAS